jgi:hypothetical protein
MMTGTLQADARDYEIRIWYSAEKGDDCFVAQVVESSQREWSRWESSDMDGQTREGETSGEKANQAMRDGQEKRGARREWSRVGTVRHRQRPTG